MSVVVGDVVFSRCRVKRVGAAQTSDGDAYGACSGNQAEIIFQRRLKGGTVVSMLKCTTCGSTYTLP